MELDNQQVVVSIICLTYNHEKFIRKTLDGFIMQKTSFPFEVLIHDDASTDHTADIIREYEKRFPEKIKPVYQKENQYSKPERKPIIKTFLLPNASGRYLAWCEGDDYWTDSFKLQKQVDSLETYPTCVACLSKVEKITFEGNPKQEYIPNCLFGDQIINGDDFVRYALNEDGFPIQFSGLMIRRAIYDQYLIEAMPYRIKFKAGDTALALYLGLAGDVYYIDKVMSHYRTGNNNSFVRRTHSTAQGSAEYLFDKSTAYEAFDRFTGYRFHNEADRAIKNHQFSAYLKIHDIKGLRKDELREYYNKLSRKEKIKEFLFYYFPSFTKTLLSVKRQSKHGFFKKNNF